MSMSGSAFDAGSKELTVLFVDVSGWTDLCARIGDAAAKLIVDSLLRELREDVQRYSGRIVKRIGDELMCLFETASAAASAACEMQRRADVRNRFETEKLFLRIGFHSGPVLIEKDDLFGNTVNTAARVTAEAFRERILATRTTVARFPEELVSLVRPWRTAALRGKESSVELVELVWREGDGTLIRSKTMMIGAKIRCLRLEYRGKEHILEPGGKPIKFGRGATNEIVVHDPTSCVSSSHGQIEFRGGIVEVVDTSRNGIYVVFDGEPPFRVNNRLALHSSGHMTLGRRPQDPEAISLQFTIE
jgi:class 3 adenylate cyclase